MQQEAGAEAWEAEQLPPGQTPFPKPRHAFGVDPSRRHFYSLRQSRYDAIASDIDRWAAHAAGAGRTLSVLDVGCGTGVVLRYLESRPTFSHLVISATDVSRFTGYKSELYHQKFVGDLREGYPEIPSDAYDVVVCEQVLEHLDTLDTAIATLERVLKPGGRLIVGVPIFIPPLHLLRKHAVPRLDRLAGRRQGRGHLQAFSLASFVREMRRCSSLILLETRGFRVISGGVLQPLEHFRWWWRLNRAIGEWVPALCIEMQAVMEKPPWPVHGGPPAATKSLAAELLKR